MVHQVNKICDPGAEVELIWGLKREAWLRSNVAPGLGGYLSKLYPVGDATVEVEITPGYSWVRAKKAVGGYGLVVDSDLVKDAERSIIYAIRDRKATPPVPPYSRKNSPYYSLSPNWWVGLDAKDDKAIKVSHIVLHGAQWKYVVDGRNAADWPLPVDLVKVAYSHQVWVFIARSADNTKYHLYQRDASGGFSLIANLSPVGTDKLIPGLVDVSPDGKKIMIVYDRMSPDGLSVVSRHIGEFALLKNPDPDKTGPVVGGRVNEVAFDSKITDERDADLFGKVTTTFSTHAGYGFDNTVRFIEIKDVTETLRPPGSESEGSPPSEVATPPFVWVMGEPSSIHGTGETTIRVVGTGGGVIATSSGVATNTQSGWISMGSNGVEASSAISTQAYSSSGGGVRLALFDPRTGAYGVLNSEVTTESSETRTTPYEVPTDNPFYTLYLQDVTYATSVSATPVTLKFSYGAITKEWQVGQAQNESSTRGDTVNAIGGRQNIGLPSFGGGAGIDGRLGSRHGVFVSRTPGEGVMNFVAERGEKVFAVVGKDKPDDTLPFFVSEDKTGLARGKEPGAYVYRVFPV